MREQTNRLKTIALQIGSEQAMINLGALIGAETAAGAVLFLFGELGSGKTTLAKGIALGLGIDDPITSPTFQLRKSYRGREILNHLDLYRLNDPAELKVLDLDELLEEGVTVIEWGDLLWNRLHSHCLMVQIEIADDPAQRCVSLSTDESRLIPLLEAIANADIGD
jgi:tRNA threonylcarbamoyladenosine biosynthesis protein TsaE